MQAGRRAGGQADRQNAIATDSFSSQCSSLCSDTEHFPVPTVIQECTDGSVSWVHVSNTLPSAFALTLALATCKHQKACHCCAATAQFVCAGDGLSPAHRLLLPSLFLWIVTVCGFCLCGCSWTLDAHGQTFHLFVPFSLNQRQQRADLNCSWQYRQIYFLPEADMPAWLLSCCFFFWFQTKKTLKIKLTRKCSRQEEQNHRVIKVDNSPYCVTSLQMIHKQNRPNTFIWREF